MWRSDDSGTTATTKEHNFFYSFSSPTEYYFQSQRSYWKKKMPIFNKTVNQRNEKQKQRQKREYFAQCIKRD